MITIIFGVPRAGKTALMTHLALEHLSGANARFALRQCAGFIESAQQGNFNKLTLPSNHLVFSDYDIFMRRRNIHAHRTNGFFLGLVNEEGHTTQFLPPYSKIYLDESQKYFNSRDGAIADFVSRFYELHGHFHLDITLACQRPNLIDLNIRELSTQVIEIVSLKHEYKHGLLISSTWQCNVFDNCYAAQKYIESGKTVGKFEKVTFTHNGNIFFNYDSFFFKALFLKNRYNEDFYAPDWQALPLTVEGVKEFCKKNNYAVPETYYKKKRS